MPRRARGDVEQRMLEKRYPIRQPVPRRPLGPVHKSRCARTPTCDVRKTIRSEGKTGRALHLQNHINIWPVLTALGERTIVGYENAGTRVPQTASRNDD